MGERNVGGDVMLRCGIGNAGGQGHFGRPVLDTGLG